MYMGERAGQLRLLNTRRKHAAIKAPDPKTRIDMTSYGSMGGIHSILWV
jgi:hypothetical protein